MKVKSNSYWRKRACEIAKKIARIKAKYKCAYCGQGEPIKRTHGSHIYAEGVYKNMSADVDNILCLCAFHHLASMPGRNNTGFSWHRTPLEAAEWFQEKYPELHKTLRLRSQRIYHVDFHKKFLELKEELKLVESMGVMKS